MNVLVLYQSPWWNAAAYYTFNVVKALKQSNHNIIFAGRDDTPLAREISHFDIKINDIDLFTYSPFKLISNIRQIKKLIIENHIDVVIPVSAPGHILIGLNKKIRIKSLPILKVCLDNVPPVNNVFNRHLHNKLTNYFLFPGLSTKKRYDKIFSINKYKILHAPLDLNEFSNYLSNSKIKKNLGIPNNKIIISFIGRFSPEKGIFFLVDIVKKAVEKSDKVFFLFSGIEGQIKHSDALKEVEESGLQEFVKIIDKVDDVRDLISITDLGLLTSRYSEFICRIVMEYMAFKVPVVAPDLNVIPEVVEDNKTGFIYDLNDSNSAVEYILNLTEDKELRKQMGESAFERLNEFFSLVNFKKELEDILANQL